MNTLISDLIRQRIVDAGGEYNCNHNISKYIQEGELDQLVAEVECQLTGVLNSLVIDIANDHNTKETAHKIGRAHV